MTGTAQGVRPVLRRLARPSGGAGDGRRRGSRHNPCGRELDLGLGRSDVAHGCECRRRTADGEHLPQRCRAGGDTLFASMYAARGISDEMKTFLGGLKAAFLGEAAQGALRASGPSETASYYPGASSDRYIRSRVERRSSLTRFSPPYRAQQERRTQSAVLYDHIAMPEFACRFRWHDNSVAFWDNRCTQHAPFGITFPPRHGHRVRSAEQAGLARRTSACILFPLG